MKVCVIQPRYPHRAKEQEELVDFLLAELDSCDDSLDLIVLPEACNGMSGDAALEAFREGVPIYGKKLLAKAEATARRCRAVVAINLYLEQDNELFNATRVFKADGSVAGDYLKQHIPPSERKKGVSFAYSRKFRDVSTINIDGVRYAFLTCYDCYFNEYIQRVAALKPDVIVVCSLQRGERRDVLAIQTQNIALVCNAFVLRSAISMGDEDHPFGGESMIVAPSGKIISSMGQKAGKLCADIDVFAKYSRSYTFGHAPIPNNLFIEHGRTPWAYRATGPSVRPGNKELPFPRVCAHRGFNSVAPENSLAALSLAVGLGAEEIEIDLWPSKDGELVVCHDETVDRTSNGSGRIADMYWDEIKKLDSGSWFSERYAGMPFCRLKDVLQRFSRQTTVNIHIKSHGKNSGYYDRDVFRSIVSEIYRYDMADHVYIAGVEDVLRTAVEIAPELPRAALDGTRDYTLVKLAREYGCERVQLFRGYYDQSMIEEAKEHGIICNLFWCDEPEDVERLINSGIDNLLANDFLAVKNALDRFLEKR
ncbi:MAG: hypothetical protein GX900_07060 [Clostridiaceae bacterium]|nr:hypothetical protein [Clostridiaceae bacterium]